jgi:MFS family permease
VTQQPGSWPTDAPSDPGAQPGYPPQPGFPPQPGYLPQPAYPPQPGYLPQPAYPPAGMPFPPVVVPPPSPGERWHPARMEPVAGTEFALVQLHVPPVASGLATGSLIAGIAAILVSFLVLCFGLAGASNGWGGWVAGAFALLAILAGGGAVAVGLVAIRQIRRSAEPGQVRFTGRGRAIAGISCGGAGAGIALAALVLTLVLQFS